jgi:hypothetical protein
MVRAAALLVVLVLVATACTDEPPRSASGTFSTVAVDVAAPSWQVRGFGWLTGWCGGDADSTCAADATVDGNLLILRTGSGAGVRTFEGTMKGRGIDALSVLEGLAREGKPPEGCGVNCDGRTVWLILEKDGRERAFRWDAAFTREEPWGPAYLTIERLIEQTAACETGLTVPTPDCEPVPPVEG